MGSLNGARSLGSGYKLNFISMCLLLEFILLPILKQVHGEHFKGKQFSEGANGWGCWAPQTVHSQALVPLFFSLFWSTYEKEKFKKLNFVSWKFPTSCFWSEDHSPVTACIKEGVTDVGSQGCEILWGHQKCDCAEGRAVFWKGKELSFPPTPCE